MKHKHTPGPWEIERTQDGSVGGIVTTIRTGPPPSGVRAIEECDEDVESEPEVFRYRIRIVETDSGYYPPREADARLIAAAPEMWQLLSDLIAIADDKRLTDHGRFCKVRDEMILSRTSDLLARIDGF